MARKRTSKSRSKRKSLAQKLDAKLLRDVLVFLFFVVAFYTVMYVVVYSGGSNECLSSQEIETGCNPELGFSAIFLLPSIVLAGLLQAAITRLSVIKHHAKKTHEKARKVLE